MDLIDKNKFKKSKEELFGNPEKDENNHMKDIKKELINVQKVTIKKINDLIDSISKITVPEVDLNQVIRALELSKKEIRGFNSSLGVAFKSMSDNLPKTPDLTIVESRLTKINSSLDNLNNSISKINIKPEIGDLSVEKLKKAISEVFQTIIIPQPPPASPPFSNSQGSINRALIDTERHLQVDVLSGGGGGTLKTDSQAIDPGDTANLIAGKDGSGFAQFINVDSDGNLQVDILSGAGGTQYTEGDTDASITGTAILMEGGSNTLLPVQGTVADGILVNLGTNNDVVVSATDLDIRNLTSTDVVTVTGGAGQTADVKITLDSESVAVTNAGITTIAGAVAGTEMQVDVLTMPTVAVTNAGTFAVQDATAQASLSVMDDWDNGASDGASVSGDVAHDTADAGEPVKVGHVAIAHGTNPTAVAAADRTNWYANRAGVPFVMGGHPNTITKSFQVTDADGAQTNADILGAISSGTKYVVTGLQVYADNTNSVNVQCRIGFGTTTTPAVDAAAVLFSHNGIAPGGGAVIGNGGGILGIGADGAELRITCSDPTGGALDIVVQYYTIES